MNPLRQSLFAVGIAAVLVGSGLVQAAAAVPPPPPHATPVAVTAGEVTSGVDVTLTHGSGSVSGRLVEARTHQPIVGELVYAVGARKNLYGEATTDTDGRFTLVAVGPAPDGLYICTAELEDYVESYHYPDECFPHAYWNPVHELPSGAQKFPMSDGEHKHVGTMRVARPASIAGRVRTAFGNDLSGTNVVVRSMSDPSLRFSLQPAYGLLTDAHGKYRFPMLPPSRAGWEVCFDNSGAVATKKGPDRFGYLNSCYRSAPWHRRRLPASATPVKVKPGRTAGGINGTAKIGGRLVGLVTDSRGERVAASISVYTRHGHRLARGVTTHGRYKITGLPRARAVQVCARANSSYRSSCAAKRVTTRPRSTVAAPDLVLHRVRHAGASIDGTVTSAGTGKPVDNARVLVFDKHGGPTRYGAITHARGRYEITGLVGSRRYIVCVSAQTAGPVPTPPPAPECYRHAPWDGSTSDVPVGGSHRILLKHQHRHGVDFALNAGGRITGTVSAADTGNHLQTDVYLFAHGRLMVRGLSDPNDGRYAFYGLGTRSYTVCFAGWNASSEHGGPYLGQCYANAPWLH